MSEHALTFTRLVVLLALLADCSTPEERSPDGDADLDVDDADHDDGPLDSDLDARDAADSEGQLEGHAARALILDQELRHHSTWTNVVGAFENAGLETTYRRFYPHLTRSDVDPGPSGQVPYSLIVLAAGRTPGNPGSLMRRQELTNARRFVEGGGALLLVPQASHRDSPSGENDFFLLNRLLESLEVSVRIDRDTVVGVVWYGDPPPPHVSFDWGYASPLEFVIGYPYLLTDGDERLAGGMTPTLRVASEEVQILLRTHDLGLRWVNNGGDPDLRLEQIDEETPVAALTRASEGFIAIVPRGPLTVSAASSISDKPAYDVERRAVNDMWLAELTEQLRDLVRGEATFEATETHDGDELFSVRTMTLLPLNPDDEVWFVGSAISDLEVPAAPPAGPVEEVVPSTRTLPRPRPGWFSEAGGRLAYGGLTSDLGAMGEAFDEIVEHEIDVLMTTTNPERLLGLDGEALETERGRYRTVAAAAERSGARWFIGGHYVGPFLAEDPRLYPRMVGAHGGEADGPAPLGEAYWEEVILPTCEEVGRLAADSPGIAGYHLDLELYNGPVWHHDGWAFSDDTVRAYGEHSGEEEMTERLLDAAPVDRLDLLVDSGSLAQYFATLEQATADLAARCRLAIRDRSPEVELSLYIAGFPNTWFYLGLLRGLGEEGRPVTVLTYDAWSASSTSALWDDGIAVNHLGGFIVGHFRPTELEEVVLAMSEANDGYWYFTFNDFSATTSSPPRLHGLPAEYWAALDRAHDRLE